MRRTVLVSAVLSLVTVFVAGCGSSDSVAPTPTYPNVAGSYSGSITITYQSLGQSITCPATTKVTQSGPDVSVATLAVTGVCPSLGLASFPAGDFLISNTGSLGTQSANNIPMASCNGTYNATATGGFSGSTLQFTFVYTVASGNACMTQLGNFTFAGNLSRV